MKLTTDALIIRENNTVGESDRFITALTRDCGVIRASVRGARQIKNRNGSATQLLCYSRLTLYKGREKYIVDDAEPLQVFFDVRGQLDKLALAQYFCELAGVLAPVDEPAEEELRLLLNALHYLAEGSRPIPLIKAITELRLLCRGGYMPAIVSCASCGEQSCTKFSPLRGEVYCTEHGAPDALPLTAGAVTAMRHIVYAPFEKCFAFSLPEADIAVLGVAVERFLLAQLNRGFNTLDFYHSLL